MPITISIQANDADEARRAMWALLGGADLTSHSPTLVLPEPASTDPTPPAEPAPVAAEPKAKGKPGHPKANPDAAPPAPPAPAPAPAPVAAAEPAPAEPPPGPGLFDDAPAAPAPKPATVDDVRNAMMAYAKQYGMPAAQSDMPQVLGAANVSQLPAGTDLNQKLADIQSAIANNPFKRAAVA